jgi:hypothetical protein
MVFIIRFDWVLISKKKSRQNQSKRDAIFCLLFFFFCLLLFFLSAQVDYLDWQDHGQNKK